MQIVKYDGTQEEYNKIVAEKTAQGLTLTNVSNVKEGNFLGFKEPIEIPVVNPIPESVETRLAAIEAKIDSILVKVSVVK